MLNVHALKQSSKTELKRRSKQETFISRWRHDNPVTANAVNQGKI